MIAALIVLTILVVFVSIDSDEPSDSAAAEVPVTRKTPVGANTAPASARKEPGNRATWA